MRALGAVPVVAAAALMAACGSAASPAPRAPPTAASSPSSTPPPAAPPTTPSAGPTLSSNCYVGNAVLGSGSVWRLKKGTTAAAGDTSAPAYAVYFLNPSNQGISVQVSGWTVAFYDAGGSELGSVTESQGTVKPQTLTSGQDLYWTAVASSAAATATGDLSDASIPVGAVSCQVASWTQ
jgi:hypothetical protein